MIINFLTSKRENISLRKCYSKDTLKQLNMKVVESIGCYSSSIPVLVQSKKKSWYIFIRYTNMTSQWG